VKRDPGLATLSREHHQALVMAQLLRRTPAETVAVATATFVDFWINYGQPHFRLEEEILLPAYAAHGDPYDPLVARALCEHVELRRLADAAAHGPPGKVEPLRRLGDLLARHVHFEERELFAMIEHAMPEDALRALGEELDRAERAG
jgi:hemerythrin-like domain-containing protein